MLLCQELLFGTNSIQIEDYSALRNAFKDINNKSRHKIRRKREPTSMVLASPAARLVSPLLVVKCDDNSTVVDLDGDDVAVDLASRDTQFCGSQSHEDQGALVEFGADFYRGKHACHPEKQRKCGNESLAQGIADFYRDEQVCDSTDNGIDIPSSGNQMYRVSVEPHAESLYLDKEYSVEIDSSIERSGGDATTASSAAREECNQSIEQLEGKPSSSVSVSSCLNGEISSATTMNLHTTDVLDIPLGTRNDGITDVQPTVLLKQVENTTYLKGSAVPKASGLSASISDENFLFQLASKIESADFPSDVLSSEMQLKACDYNVIFHALKSSGKIVALFHYLRTDNNRIANSSNDVYASVFEVLGKRHEWALMDSLLLDMLACSRTEINCRVFNSLFHVCDTFRSPDSATKWFHCMVEEGVQPNVTTFMTIMHIYQRHKMFKEAEFAYFSMISAGITCYRASLIMMTSYSGVSQFSKMNQIFGRILDENPRPHLEFFLLILDGYVHEGKVRESEEIMKYVLDSGFSVGVAAYNSMITVNGKAGYFYSARGWFHKIEEDGLARNTTTYRSVIGACGRAGKYQEALNYYDEMKSCGFSPSLANFNTLIHLHRKVDSYKRIFTLLLDMREAGCRPDSSTLHSILKVYERYGRVGDIPEALRHLREAGWQPGAKCFGLLIRTYIRHSMVEQALEAFNDLCSVTKPEEIMCHNLICMCKSTGHYDEAIYVFQQMQQLVPPSLMTSCTMIDIYSLKGAIGEGEALFQQLRSSRKVLDPVTYNVVLTMYLREGKLDKAEEIMKIIMEQEDFQPDLYLFLCMLRVCSKCGLKEEAVDIYWRIVNSTITWTEPLYAGIIHCCGRALPLVEVMKMFDAIVDAGMPINTLTFNVLIDIFGKAGLLDKAHDVLRVSQKLGVHDSISYSTLIDAYGKNKEFCNMKSVFTEMRIQGFKGCVEAYNAMIDAYGMSGQIDQMEDTFHRMGMVGCQPNLSTFNTLIKVYGQERLMDDLKGVLKDMEHRNMIPDCYTYNTLVFAYGNAEMLDEALNSFGEMQRAGCTPDRITYNCLITAFQKGGCNREAMRLTEWVTEKGL